MAIKMKVYRKGVPVEDMSIDEMIRHLRKGVTKLDKEIAEAKSQLAQMELGSKTLHAKLDELINEEPPHA